jgi:flagellar motor component MotA
MTTEKQNDSDNWISIFLGVFVIFAIKSIFEHDNSKIVSQKGSNFLSDEKKMKEISAKIKELEKNSNQQEVFI